MATQTIEFKDAAARAAQAVQLVRSVQGWQRHQQNGGTRPVRQSQKTPHEAGRMVERVAVRQLWRVR